MYKEPQVLPMHMLAYMVTYTSSVIAIYNEVAADIKCQIHILFMDKHYIQQIQQHNF